MKLLYGIGTKRRVNGGHGDSHEELVIAPIGSYGEKGYPPLFNSPQSAQQYIKDQGLAYHEVIPLKMDDKVRYFKHIKGFDDGTVHVEYHEETKETYLLDDKGSKTRTSLINLPYILKSVAIGQWIEFDKSTP
jgi:hypothetical protein